MKKYCLMFLSFLILIAGFLGANIKETKTEYLRIHIRADSNDEKDQAVKYKVKDAVVNFLTPIIADCTDKAQAERALSSNLSRIESVADSVLKSNGFDYKSTAAINNEKFPTRNYGELTLNCGYYDALIINLGSGKGDNWWCVVYPPLCFTDAGTNYVYKSKIYEIIKKFFNEKENI